MFIEVKKDEGNTIINGKPHNIADLKSYDISLLLDIFGYIIKLDIFLLLKRSNIAQFFIRNIYYININIYYNIIIILKYNKTIYLLLIFYLNTSLK